MSLLQRPQIQPISARRFRELAAFLETQPTPAEILLRVHAFLDEWMAFRSQRLSAAALQAVHQVIRDMGWTLPGADAPQEIPQDAEAPGDPGGTPP